MWIAIWDRYFETDPTIVGDGEQGIDRMQLSTLIFWVVDAADAEAIFESKRWGIAQDLGDVDETLSLDVERQFTAIDDDLLDRIREERIGAFQFIGDLIEVGTVGTLA